MNVRNKKLLACLGLTLMASKCIHAQEMNLTKDQFLQMTEQMLVQSEDLKAQMETSADAQMKQYLSPEQYEQYKAEKN